MLRLILADELRSSAFAERWQALLRRCPPYDIGQTELWNRCWWRHYGEDGSAGKELFVIADEDQGQLLSLWPLFVRRRFGLKVLSWIGQVDGMITDYTLPLLPVKQRDEAARKFLQFIGDNTSRWDIADLSLPGWSGLLGVVTKAAAIHGARRKLAWGSHVIEQCTAINLPGTFDDFLATLGSTTRSHVRQYLRAADKVGATLEIVRGDGCGAALADLLRLNRERWEVFADDRARAFLADYLACLTPGDDDVFIASLRCQGLVLATILGFENQNVCYLHSAGVARDSSVGFSPGTAMYALLIRNLIEQGRVRVDMSPGMEEYKLRLGAEVDCVFGVTLWHRPWTSDRWRLGQAMVAARRWAIATGRRFTGAPRH